MTRSPAVKVAFSCSLRLVRLQGEECCIHVRPCAILLTSFKERIVCRKNDGCSIKKVFSCARGVVNLMSRTSGSKNGGFAVIAVPIEER